MLPFELERPRSLAEAVELLAHREGAMAKAGGTDLLVWMKKHAIRPEVLVDLTGIPELKGLSFDPLEGLRIGALTTLNELAEDDHARRLYPVLVQAALSHSDPLIRNRATAIGNVCSSVPSGDLIPSFLVQEAILRIVGPGGEREVPMGDFIVGPRRNVLERGEILVSALFPPPEGPSAGCYLKLGRRNALDLAQVGVACLAVDGPAGRRWRLAFGAVAPRPVRATAAEEMLAGVLRPDEALLARVSEAAVGSVDPITDVRASREYRLAQVGELTVRAVRICAETMGEGSR
jgi:carbon-monoxide dehydrogenase medium subunit